MTTQTINIKYVNQGLTQAQAGINAFNKSLMNLQKQSKASNSFKLMGQNIFPAKVADNVKKQIGDITAGIGKAVPGFNQFSKAMGLSATNATALAATLGGVVVGIGAVATAAGVAAIAFKAFFDTGKRGLQIESTLGAFGNAVAAFGDSTQVLKNLRVQTRGTISDVELMRLTIATLQGSSQDFRKVVAPNLGKVFDVTARAARATGRDVDEVREKFVTGLRLMSNRRLDDIGVTVNQAKANEAYAASIGKAVAQLTELDKQAAFASEAIRQLDNLSKETGSNNLVEVFAKASTLFQNFRDQISVAILPAFKPFVEQLDLVIAGFSRLAGFAIPVIAAIAENFGIVFSIIFKVNNAIAGFVAQATGLQFWIDNLDYVIAAALIFRDVILSVGKSVYITVYRAVAAFQALAARFNILPAVGEQMNVDLVQLAFNLGKGGAAIIGAFAAGILKGGTLVAKAVNKIASIVADFLVGLSPPKMGPLSQIDKGGENVIRAWAGGFISGIKQPLTEVTQYVSMRLGEIGAFSRDQVEARLLQLDNAIQPFKDSLDIVKADLEAISGFVDPALEALDRQREGIIKKFELGGGGDLSQLRFLDSQAERLKELKTLEQDRVDQAQIQLALAQSAQVQERTLLNIRKAQFGEAEKLNSETSKAQKEIGDKALKGTGGSGGGVTDEVGGGFVGGAPPDFLKNEEIEAAKQRIKDFGNAVAGAGRAGIAEGFANSGFSEAGAGFANEISKLQATQNKIKGADPVSAITDKFKGLGEGVLEPLNTFKTNVQAAFDSLFSPDAGTVQLRITGFLSGLTTAFTSIDLSGFIDPFLTAFGAEGTVTTALNSVKAIFDSLFGIGEESSIMIATTAITTFADVTIAKMTELKDRLTNTIGSITAAVNGFFNGEESVIYKSQLAATAMVSNVVAAFASFSGEGIGTIQGALSGFKGAIQSGLINTTFDVMQGLTDLIINSINKLIETFNAQNPLDKFDLKPLGRVELDRPTLQAKGGIGINKPFIAGEKGAELIVPKKPVNIFPTQATAALQSLAAMPMYYGGNTTNNNNTNIQNTYNVGSVGQASLLQRQQAAMMR